MVFFLRAQAHAALGNFDEAKQDAEMVAKLASTDDDRKHAQQLKEVVAQAEAGAAVKGYLDRANQAMEAGCFERGLPLLNEAAGKAPHVAAIFFLRAQAHAALGHFVEARQDAETVANLAETLDDRKHSRDLTEAITQVEAGIAVVKGCLVDQAYQAMKDGRSKDALSLLNEAARKAPNMIAIFFLRAQAHAVLGNLAEAKQDAERIATLAETDDAHKMAQRLKEMLHSVYASSEPGKTESVQQAGRSWFARVSTAFRNRRSSASQADSGGHPSQAGAGVPKPRNGTPEVPGGTADRVQFSVTSPPCITPGTSHVIDVWAHLEQQRQEVISRARMGAIGGDVIIRSKGPVTVARGTIITARLRLPDFDVEPQEDTIYWDGEIGNAQFTVRVPMGISTGKRQGHVVFMINGLPIAKLVFEIQIALSSAQADRLAARVQRYHHVFASYASSDSDAVLARIQGLLKGRPDIDVFYAEANIQPGERWHDRLQKEITKRDALYLFWSRAASVSEHVEWEWRCALKEHGIDFIDPVPLVHPKEVPPPPELCALHFNDWVLGYMSGQPLGEGGLRRTTQPD